MRTRLSRLLFSSSCPGLSRASTTSLMRRLKTWMAGTSPAMTSLFDISQIGKREASSPIEMLRLRWRRIVKEPLAKEPVAAPFLQRDFVDPAHLAGFIGEFEDPVDGNMVALDHRGHRLGSDMRHQCENAALAGHQHVAADAPRRRVLLHAGILGVIALDGAGMIA